MPVVRLCAWLVALPALAGGPVPAAAAEGAVAQLGPVAVRMGAPFYSGAVLPTPRQVRYEAGALVLADGPGGAWRGRLVYPREGNVRELMERLVGRRTAPYLAQFARLAPASLRADVPVVRFAFTTAAEATGLASRYGLPDTWRSLPPQGYVLTVRPEGALCLAPDNPGLVNGLASLLQLLRVDEGRLVVSCATLTDWPTFRLRYTSEYYLANQEFLDWMMLYKLNGFAACYPGMRWSGLTEGQRPALAAIGDYVSRYGTASFLVELHIGGRGGERPVDCGDPQDVETLLNTIRETMRLARPQHVMICYDDVAPELQPQEQGRFERPALAHGAVMEVVYRAVKALDARTVVSFCSPYYQGRGHRRWREDNPRRPEALQYLADLRTWPNHDIRIVWTGPVTESKVIVPEDIADYRERVGAGRQLFYWDNTWHYHQPLRNFHARYPAGFVKDCADATAYVNINGIRPLGRFFSVTANDYYWNPEAFDSVRSRQQAVAQVMGAAAVPAAEEFYRVRGDDYYVFFSRDVDLEALRMALERLRDASLTPELPALCLAAYQEIVKGRQKEKP